ncbi:MAG: hypothetical protein IKP22_13760, partial [Clostridia bacterium]|nr:hypothetical protein [Clostridia bacterium]
IDIINLRIRVLRTLMPRKARHTVSCDPERAFGAIKRHLAFLNRISMSISRAEKTGAFFHFG